MNLGDERVLKFDMNFGDNDTCHYTFAVNDQVSQVNSSNQKYMQIFVEQFDALDIFIAAGDNEKSLLKNDVRKVTTGERNFTMPPTKKFFIMVNGT